MAAILYNKTDSDSAVFLNVASTELKDLYMYLYDLSGIEGLYNFKLCVKNVQYYVIFFFYLVIFGFFFFASPRTALKGLLYTGHTINASFGKRSIF